MFSLLVTILSIALVAALAFATLYYGAAAYTRAHADAEAAKIKSQGQQLLGAAELFRAQIGRYPNNESELVDQKFLRTIPVAQAAMVQAFAQEHAWSMPVPGVAAFVLPTSTPETCMSVNSSELGERGILKSLSPVAKFQCYGEDVSTLRTLVVHNRAALQDTVDDEDSPLAGTPINDGTLPPKEDSAWLVPPKSGTDSGGTPGGTPPVALASMTPVTSANFGIVEPGTTQTREFAVNFSGTQAATGIYAALTPRAGVSITQNSCGTQGAPLPSVEPGQACSVAVSVNSSQGLTLEGLTLSVHGSFQGAVVSQALSGTVGNFDVQAHWASTYAGAAPVSVMNIGFGSATQSMVYLRHVGSSGRLSARMRLEGDTEHFYLSTLGIVNANSSGACTEAPVSLPPGTTVTPKCTAQERGGLDALRLQLIYLPKSLGSHSVRLVAETDDGAIVPAALEVTGNSYVDASMSWSTMPGFTVAPDVNMTAAVGGSTTRPLYLRNTGTSAAVVGFRLVGDISHFTFAEAPSLSDSMGPLGTCASLTESGKATTECTTSAYAKAIYAPIQYRPLSAGTHTVQVVLTTSNGTTLPQTLVLQGRQP